MSNRFLQLWGIRHLYAAGGWVHRRLQAFWEKLSLETLLRVLVVSLILSLCVQAYNTAQVKQQTTKLTQLSRSNRQLGDNNRLTLKAIQEQTSPEAIARQKAQVQDIIGIIDCNQRQALQDALQGLVERDILNPEDVVTITRACEQQQQHNTTTTMVPGTTTTTIAGAGD